jgi:hypothetical protein
VDRGIQGATGLSELDIAMDVTGDWAIRSLLRMVHAGFQLDGLGAMRLQIPCQNQTIHGIQQLAASLGQPPAFLENRLTILELNVSHSQLDVSTGRFLFHAIRRMRHLSQLTLNLSDNPTIGNFALLPLEPKVEAKDDAPLLHLTLMLNRCAMGACGYKQWMRHLGNATLWPNQLETLAFHCMGNRITNDIGERTVSFPMKQPNATRLLIDVRDNGATAKGESQMKEWIRTAKSHHPGIKIYVLW